MKLELIRDLKNDKYTLGKLSIDGVFFCYTVEDAVRDLKDLNNDGDFDDKGEGKVYGETAIPAGTYDIIINMSNRFKKLMPLLLNVPGYSGVRIHSGNTALDTLGCIIIGIVRTPNGVGMSRVAFNKLMAKLENQNNITITIK